MKNLLSIVVVIVILVASLAFVGAPKLITVVKAVNVVDHRVVTSLLVVHVQGKVLLAEHLFLGKVVAATQVGVAYETPEDEQLLDLLHAFVLSFERLYLLYLLLEVKYHFLRDYAGCDVTRPQMAIHA